MHFACATLGANRACEAKRGDSVRASFDVRYTRDAYATVRHTADVAIQERRCYRCELTRRGYPATGQAEMPVLPLLRVFGSRTRSLSSHADTPIRFPPARRRRVHNGRASPRHVLLFASCVPPQTDY
jgi:hypothetical protein